MKFQQITENRKDYLDYLLLTDPQEDMIDRYLDSGDMFALYDGGELCTLAVVTDSGDGSCEIRNLVTVYGHRGKGYTRAMIYFLSERYRGRCGVMYANTISYGESLRTLQICGFEYSHRLAGFVAEHYREPIILDGERIEDLVYLKKDLHADPDTRKVAELALHAGQILLKSGAEIFRVEETMTRICRRFHVEEVEPFVLSHGIFLSVSKKGEETLTRVKNVPLSGANLEAVADVNDLSRRIAAGMVGLDEAEAELDRIEAMPPKKKSYLILSTGIGSACFGAVMGAGAKESACVVVIASILYVWVMFAQEHKLSKIVVNMFGGMLITVLSVAACAALPLRLKLDSIIIGSILPLVPGLAFVNAIRDIADSDFLSGTVRMIDALLVFVYIAIGVGLALSVFERWIGGVGL